MEILHVSALKKQRDKHPCPEALYRHFTDLWLLAHPQLCKHNDNGNRAYHSPTYFKTCSAASSLGTFRHYQCFFIAGVHLLSTGNTEMEEPPRVKTYSRLHGISEILKHLQDASHVWEGDISVWPYTKIDGVGDVSHIVFEVMSEKPTNWRHIDLHAQRGFYGPGTVFIEL